MRRTLTLVAGTGLLPVAAVLCAGAPAGTPKSVGTPSCSARACHGADTALAGPISRDEYTRWNQTDPHARSYRVLFNDVSIQMMRHLKPGKPDAKAYRDDRCLACHADPVSGSSAARESVGCEVCHGPAADWLGPHTLGQGWRTKYPAAATGLTDLNDVATLARTCVGCHVGAPPGGSFGPRDMNHDLIAAGHPRLNFEFAAYLAALPPHWNVAARPHGPQHTARAWAVGQFVAAEAALDLLAYRSAQPSWLELSEYACYACHHDLAGPTGWRQKAETAGRTPGELAWGTWYFAAVPALAPGAAKDVAELAKLMARRPAGPAAAEKATALKAKLSPLAVAVIQQAGDAAAVKALRERLAKELKPVAERDWDGAAQTYLALAALLGDDAKTRSALEAFLQALREPGQFRRADEFVQQLNGLLDRAGAK